MHCGLNVLGDRWTLTIIRDLLFFNRSTFTELLQSPEKIATNTLASRLASLAEQGIVEQNKQNKRYHLTEKGFDLVPVLLELALWTEKYDSSVLSVTEEYQRFRENPQAFIDELKSGRVQAAMH